MIRFIVLINLFLVACSTPAKDDAKIAAQEAVAAAKVASSSRSEEVLPPGTGVLCMAGLLSVAVEIGRVCYPGDNPEGQKRLQGLLKQLHDYMLLDPDWTPDRLAKFNKEQGGTGFQEFQSCIRLDNDTRGIYKNFVTADANAIKSYVDKLTAKPGKPTWGDCL